MAIRIVIYGKPGDGGAFAAMAQIRSLIRELRVDATVQIVTDEQQLQMNGIDDPPAVLIDGSQVSIGYVPSRTEMAGYIRQRQTMLAGRGPSMDM